MANVGSNGLRLSYLLILALVIRLVLFFGGVRGSDSYAYAQHAYAIVIGQYDVTADTTQYYPFRYAVLLPTALAYKVLGVNDWSSALFPLLASLATLVLVTLIGTAWFDRRTGLMAGLLYSFFPLDLPNATLVGPSSFQPFFSAAAAWCFLRAAGRPMRGVWYLASGVFVGFAAQSRETGLLLLLPLILFEISRGAPNLRHALLFLCCGCAAPLAVESFYYYLATGNPLHRLGAVQNVAQLYAYDGQLSWAYYPRAMLGLDLGGFAWYGLFVYLALGGITLAFARNEFGRIKPLLLWIFPIFVYMEFASKHLLTYVPIDKNYHYLCIISVPIVLLGAYTLVTLWEAARQRGFSPAWRRTGAVLVLAVLAATSLYGSYRVLENIRDDARPYQVVAEAVQAHPERTIYVPHERWALFLNYYLRSEAGSRFDQRTKGVGSGRVHYLWEISDPSNLDTAYVVLHDRYLYYDTIGRPVGRTARLPPYVFNPPASWQVVVREQARPAYNSFVLYETGRQKNA